MELHVVEVKQIKSTDEDDEIEEDIPMEREEHFKEAIGEGVWLPVCSSSPLALSLITSYQKGNNIPM